MWLPGQKVLQGSRSSHFFILKKACSSDTGDRLRCLVVYLRLFLIREVLGASQAAHPYPLKVRLVFISVHFGVEFKSLFC